MSAQLKVFSFNLRLQVEADGINSFNNRKNRVLDCIAQYTPDIIGFQEVTDDMRVWLKMNLKDYTTVGIGRTGNYTGEGCFLAFKTDLIDLIALDHVMMSSTPKVPGSLYDGSDQSHCPRIYIRALLKHRDIDQPFYFYDVHTDHKGELARCFASMQLVQDIASHDKMFIMTGDFNAAPDSAEIKLITATKARPIVDITEGMSGTYHGFGVEKEPWKIDYIFVDPRIKVLSCQKIQDQPIEGVYISDHNPVYAVLEF